MQQKNKRGLPVPHLEVGQTIVCLCSADNRCHTAKILKISDNAEDEKVYVHYVNYPSRLDEWVARHHIDMDADPESDLDVLEDACFELRRTRSQRRKGDDTADISSSEKNDGTKQPEERVKNIESIVLGFTHFHKIVAWYYSPFPQAYIGDAKQLLICEYCLQYFPKKQIFLLHKEFCWRRHSPGVEIYNHKGISVFEVDGATSKVYCQCLCLVARLFLEHKTLCFDVESFMFYIMFVEDQDGRHLVGYFSKEKVSLMGYNLACILVVPPYQQVGYGCGLIQLAYELSRRLGVIGTPERPLSDLGLRGFFSYWKRAILEEIREMPRPGTFSVSDLVARTSISADDVVSTLERLDLITGSGNHYRIRTDGALSDYLSTLEDSKFSLDFTHLHWPVVHGDAYVANRRGEFFDLQYTHLGTTTVPDDSVSEGGASGGAQRPHANGKAGA